MTPQLFSQLDSTTVIAWGSLTAVRARRAATRVTLLSGLITALAMLLLVRLITDLEAWTS